MDVVLNAIIIAFERFVFDLGAAVPAAVVVVALTLPMTYGIELDDAVVEITMSFSMIVETITLLAVAEIPLAVHV